MSEDLEFKGIEVGEESRPGFGRAQPRTLGQALCLTFGGSLAANVLFLTFFGSPFAAGWYFALLWICLAWSVLGTGTIVYRSATAMLFCVVGMLPLLPVVWMASSGFDGTLSVSIFEISMAAPSYVAFWFYRVFRGRFSKLDAMQAIEAANEIPRLEKTSLFGLFQLMTVCAVPLAIIPAISQYFGGNASHEVLELAAMAIPAAFLIPVIRMTCGANRNGRQVAFRYVAILCAAVGAASAFGIWCIRGNFGAATLTSLVLLLVYFSTGGFLIVGLCGLRDNGYRFTTIR